MPTLHRLSGLLRCAPSIQMLGAVMVDQMRPVREICSSSFPALEIDDSWNHMSCCLGYDFCDAVAAMAGEKLVGITPGASGSGTARPKCWQFPATWPSICFTSGSSASGARSLVECEGFKVKDWSVSAFKPLAFSTRFFTSAVCQSPNMKRSAIQFTLRLRAR